MDHGPVSGSGRRRHLDGPGGADQTTLKTHDSRKQRGNLGYLAVPLLHRDEKVEGCFLASLIGPFHANDVVARFLKDMLGSCVAFFVFLFRTSVRLHCHRCAAVSKVPGFLAERRPTRSNQEGYWLPGTRTEAGPIGSMNGGCEVFLTLLFGCWLRGDLNHCKIVRAVTTTVRHFENLAVGARFL